MTILIQENPNKHELQGQMGEGGNKRMFLHTVDLHYRGLEVLCERILSYAGRARDKSRLISD